MFKDCRNCTKYGNHYAYGSKDTGWVSEDDAFEFTLSSTTALVETVTNKQGMVTFSPLTFQTPGTYIYTISEVRGDDDGINYDPHTETITVTVADDGADRKHRPK